MQSCTKMTICNTCISWNEGKAHLSSRLTHRSNKVHQSHVQRKQVDYTVLTTLDLMYIFTCLIPRLFLGIEKRASLNMLLSQFPQFWEVYWSATTSGSTEFTQALCLQELFSTMYEPCRSLQLTKCRLFYQRYATPSPPINAKDVSYLSSRLLQIMLHPKYMIGTKQNN